MSFEDHIRNLFICRVCLVSYDRSRRQPMSLLNCSHSICKLCLNKLEHSICPHCREPFSAAKLNYEVLQAVPEMKRDDILNEAYQGLGLVSHSQQEFNNHELQIREAISAKIDSIGQQVRLQKEIFFQQVVKREQELLQELANVQDQFEKRISAVKDRASNDANSFIQCLTLANNNAAQVSVPELSKMVNNIDKVNSNYENHIVDFDYLLRHLNTLSFRTDTPSSKIGRITVRFKY